MKSHTLGMWMLCGAMVIGLASHAEAVQTDEQFQFNFRGKVWCGSSSNPSRGEFQTFNEINTKKHIGVGVTITRDPSNSGDGTDLQAQLSPLPGAESDVLVPELAAITMNGVGFPANKSGNSAEFVLHGVNGTDSSVFFTMRGKATLDTKNLINGLYPIKKASGTWVGAILDDRHPGEHCFADGTFVTGTKLP